MKFSESQVLMRDEKKYIAAIRKDIVDITTKKLVIDLLDQVAKSNAINIEKIDYDGHTHVNVSLIVVTKEQWDDYQKFLDVMKGLEYADHEGNIVTIKDFFEPKAE